MGVPDAPEGPLQRRGRPLGGLPRRDGCRLDPPRDPRRAGHATSRAGPPTRLAGGAVRHLRRCPRRGAPADPPSAAGRRGDEAGRRAVRLHDQPHGQAAPRGRHLDALPRPGRGRAGSLEAIEAKKTLAGKDFGELVRERRRQFGLPLPIAEKVLPFRAAREQPRTSASPEGEGDPSRTAQPDSSLGWRELLHDSWTLLAAAELRGATTRELDALEATFLRETARVATVTPPGDDSTD